MVEDVVRSLGLLALGSRFKRLSERLYADTQRILDEYEGALPSGQYPILASLGRLGPLTIGELSEAIGISQPGITRTVAQLKAAGIVRVGTGEGDQRRRVVTLTSAGEAEVARSSAQMWPRVEAAVTDLCGDLNGSLLDILNAIDDRLAEKPLDRRAPRKEVRP